MAPTWSLMVTATLAAVASAQSVGVLAYPAGEGRISPTCFTRGSNDPFTCGWYCAHAFYVETDPDGQVVLTPFGEGNNADNAYCADCSLFEGDGMSGDLASGDMAGGFLYGGYKWEATYDSEAQEINMNFTDYDEPCLIRYVVTEGEVMGVSAASGRPATDNTEATLIMTGWGGPKIVCQASLANCINWHVYVQGDVADWQSLDEEATTDVCPSRVTVYGLSNGEYMGHDGTPRGVDSWSEPDDDVIVSDRNTIISWSNPFNMTRCKLYFTVTQGCWNEVGPECYGQKQKDLQAGLPSLEQRLAKVKQQRSLRKLKNKQQAKGRATASQLPMAKPRGVSASAWNAAMPHEGDFSSESPSWLEKVLPDNVASLAGWAVAAALISVWVARRKCQRDGYKAIPQRNEASPLLSA